MKAMSIPMKAFGGARLLAGAGGSAIVGNSAAQAEPDSARTIATVTSKMMEVLIFRIASV